mmetsp:Transcript_68546/g.198913  ORF Transcript_68546/g.198913 Transcript_68546/m.198913 type:complete len:266 (-) Transcript_68546:520-1317(-)
MLVQYAIPAISAIRKPTNCRIHLADLSDDVLAHIGDPIRGIRLIDSRRREYVGSCGSRSLDLVQMRLYLGCRQLGLLNLLPKLGQVLLLPPAPPLHLCSSLDALVGVELGGVFAFIRARVLLVMAAILLEYGSNRIERTSLRTLNLGQFCTQAVMRGLRGRPLLRQRCPPVLVPHPLQGYRSMRRLQSGPKTLLLVCGLLQLSHQARLELVLPGDFGDQLVLTYFEPADATRQPLCENVLLLHLLVDAPSNALLCEILLLQFAVQ